MPESSVDEHNTSGALDTSSEMSPSKKSKDKKKSKSGKDKDKSSADKNDKKSQFLADKKAKKSEKKGFLGAIFGGKKSKLKQEAPTTSEAEMDSSKDDGSDSDESVVIEAR